MAYVDFKITAWERVSIGDERLDEVLEKIKNGNIQTSTDLFYTLNDDCSNEGILYETGEQLSLQDNDGYSTIEIIQDGRTLYGNGHGLDN
jgi:hypothetical protein